MPDCSVMAATKLSSQDKKDLDKFTKYLVYKSIQVIVQSRLGEKIRTQSKAFSSGSDWFNLAIRDIPEVFNETKKALANQNLSIGQSVCVEISLRTAEGETMILETWWLAMNEQCDSNVRVSYTVYNRMGILLKSLFCVTRVTPAYILSRKQGPDSYVICYRIYLGEPQKHCLGDGCQNVKVGAVPTPMGTITLNAAYRTKLLISPCNSRDLTIELKDDHFKSDSPRKNATTAKPCHVGYRDARTSVVDEIAAACVESEVCTTSFSTSPPDPCLYPNLYNTHGNSPPMRFHRRMSLENKIEKPEEFRPHSVPDRVPSFSEVQKMGAFAPVRETEHKPSYDDVPFIALLQPGEVTNQDSQNLSHDSDTQDSEEQVDGMARSSGSGSNKSNSSHSGPEDFVMVELKTPFAGTDANTDLGKFYRDCQGAPPLVMFEEDSSVHEQLENITDQLAIFEANLTDFDDFVNSLQTTEG